MAAGGFAAIVALFTHFVLRNAPITTDLSSWRVTFGVWYVGTVLLLGFGACYVCMRTFEVDGKKVLRRVCRDGPVFNMQEAVGW